MSDSRMVEQEAPTAADEPPLTQAPASGAATPKRSRPLMVCFRLTMLSALLLSAALYLFWPHMDAFGQSSGETGPVILPWIFHTTGTDNRLTVTLAPSWSMPREWHVIPDDDLGSIEINGKQVSLEDIRRGGLQDYKRGFDIDLSRYFGPGENTIVLRLDNRNGDGGLSFRPRLGILRWSIITACFLPMLIGLAALFGLGASQIVVLALALLVLGCYWSATPWQVRTHDAVGDGGHVGYVMRVAYDHVLPAPTEGWTYYHPPLYYILGAVVWRWAKLFSLPGPESLQALSLGLWLVFLTASCGAMRITLRARPVALFVATAALALWPSGIIHSVRLGNDAALYAVAGIAMWFTIRWWKSRRRSDLVGLTIASALALLCKSNAIALAAACGALVLAAFARRPNKRTAIDLALFWGIALPGFAASFAVRIYYFLNGRIPNWLIPNSDRLDSALRVPVDVRSFLPIDIQTFLVSPWMSPWRDDTGRANFWNFVLRSGFTGEFEFDGSLHRAIAILWGIILLSLLATMLVRTFRSLNVTRIWRHLPWSFFALFWIASLILLRIQIPFSCHNDFRFILPILVPAILCWSLGGRGSKTLLLFLAMLSALFFTTLSEVAAS